MLDRKNIHNSAMLKPAICKSLSKTGEHAYAPVKGEDYQQCVDCGNILKKARIH